MLEFASQITEKSAKVRVYIYNLEDQMTKSQYPRFSWKRSWPIAGILFLGAIWQLGLSLQAQSSSSPLNENDALLDSYRHVEVASVSDALEQLTGRKMYLSHRVQAIFPAKFAGFALTVKLNKDEGTKDPAALSGMLAAIDQGTRNSVWVMVVEDGADIAGMGGLMGTAMSSRGYSGAVIDGGVRDVGQLRKIGFPVYATGIVPSTSVGHYRFAGAEIPVTCDGVEVNPGDIVAADGDGVVIVPRAKAKEVLAVAQEMDFKEHSMYSIIEKYKSIQEAVKRFGRL
jgi:regulator of RNase E activity RraA